DEQSVRPIWWVHVTRDRLDHAFADEAAQLLASLPQARVRIFYTAADADLPADGNVTRGRPTADALAALGLPTDASAYICGPTAFRDAMSAALVALGLSAQRVHTELFGARSAITPGVTDVRRVPPHPPAGPPGTGPSVTFARSGLAVPWSDAQPSLLD